MSLQARILARFGAGAAAGSAADTIQGQVVDKFTLADARALIAVEGDTTIDEHGRVSRDTIERLFELPASMDTLDQLMRLVPLCDQYMDFIPRLRTYSNEWIHRIDLTKIRDYAQLEVLLIQPWCFVQFDLTRPEFMLEVIRNHPMDWYDIIRDAFTESDDPTQLPTFQHKLPWRQFTGDCMIAGATNILRWMHEQGRFNERGLIRYFHGFDPLERIPVAALEHCSVDLIMQLVGSEQVTYRDLLHIPMSDEKRIEMLMRGDHMVFITFAADRPPAVFEPLFMVAWSHAIAQRLVRLGRGGYRFGIRLFAIALQTNPLYAEMLRPFV